MVTYIRDSIDKKSLVISTIIGLAITLLVQILVDPLIIAQRHRVVIGGEMFLYGAILALVTFIAFQIVTKILHRWARRCRKFR